MRLGNCGILWFSSGGEPESAGGSRPRRRGTFRERPRAEQHFRATHRIRDYQKEASNRPLWLDAFFFESVFHRFRRRRTLSHPAVASVAGTRSGSFQTPALRKLGAKERHDLLFLSRHLDLRQPEIVRDLLLGHVAVIPEQDDLLPERLHFSDRL